MMLCTSPGSAYKYRCLYKGTCADSGTNAAGDLAQIPAATPGLSLLLALL